MDHLREIELIRLVDGSAKPPERLAAEQHLQACEPCRALLADLRQTWSALGAWDANAAGRDVHARVLAAASAREPARAGRPWWSTGWRAAAAVIAGAAIGHLAGRWALQGGPAAPVAAVDPAAVASAADVVELALFEQDSGIGLAEGLLLPAADEEPQP